jgi:hypothetical protein
MLDEADKVIQGRVRILNVIQVQSLHRDYTGFCEAILDCELSEVFIIVWVKDDEEVDRANFYDAFLFDLECLRSVEGPRPEVVAIMCQSYLLSGEIASW